MQKNKKLFVRFISVVFVVWLIAGTGFAFSLFLGCEDEECLVRDENCTESYKEANYDTTDISCCEGTRADHSVDGKGTLTCR